MKNSMQKLAVPMARQQQEMVNSFLEGNPIIDSIPMKAATHGIYNVFGEVTDIKAAGQVDFDAPLPTVGVTTQLGQANLTKIGGILPIPMDLAANMGGDTVFINQQVPPVITKSGNDLEAAIYYNSFINTAVKNGTAVSAGGSAANQQYSMVAVHWDNASVTGLYNSNVVGNGKIFEQLLLDGGNTHKLADGALGKELAIYTQMGLQIADKRYIGAIVNIQIGTDASGNITGLPTASQIDDLVAGVRGNPANTYIYAHPAIISKIGLKYKLEKRTVIDNATNITYTVTDWDGIRFIGSYNIKKGTEPVVTLS